MSSRNRARDRRRVSHLYVDDAPFGSDICAYCGEIAQTLDHVLPVSAASILAERIGAQPEKFRHAMKVVPSCYECNVLAGSRYFGGLREKREYLARRLSQRYAALLGAADWGEAELQEIGPSLQRYIRSSEARSEVATRRVRFARSHGLSGLR